MHEKHEGGWLAGWTSPLVTDVHHPFRRVRGTELGPFCALSSVGWVLLAARVAAPLASDVHHPHLSMPAAELPFFSALDAVRRVLPASGVPTSPCHHRARQPNSACVLEDLQELYSQLQVPRAIWNMRRASFASNALGVVSYTMGIGIFRESVSCLLLSLPAAAFFFFCAGIPEFLRTYKGIRLVSMELPEPLFFSARFGRPLGSPSKDLPSRPPLTHAVKVSQQIAIGFRRSCGCVLPSTPRSSALGQNKRA